MKVKILLIIFFIFQSYLWGDSNKKVPLNAEYLLAQDKPKEVVVYDLKVFTNPYLPFLALTENSELKPVKIPFIQKIVEPSFANYRSIWISGKFDVESTDRFITSGLYGSSGLYGIRLGLVPAINLVYINDKLIGKSESSEIDHFLWPSSYSFPAGFVLKKTNKVDIRFITHRRYLTFLSDIVIQNRKSYFSSEKWNNFLYNQLPMGFCVLFSVIIIVLLYNFFTYKIKRYLFYSLFLSNMLISLLLIYSPTSFLNFDLIIMISKSLSPVNLLLFMFMYQALFGIYLWKHNIISVLIVLPVSIITLASINIIYELDNYLISIFCIQVLIYIYMIYMIHLLNSLKHDRFILNLSITLYSISLILDLIQAFGVAFNIWYHHFYFLYSTPFYLLIVIIYEIKMNKRKRIELEKLEKKFLKNDQNNSHALTESAEKKIEKVVDFLNENFTEDISREGLASVIDMNPNYMSKLFYQHTGKKINEYINYLRIRTAAMQLTESYNGNGGRKIIDIALAAGFDSLSTFNRAFKNVYNITPTEYRKKYYNELT